MFAFHRSEFMRQFLLYGHVLSTEEAELYADYELKKNPPTLDNFKEQVCARRVHTGRGSEANRKSNKEKTQESWQFS